jgi:hypothetical protein
VDEEDDESSVKEEDDAADTSDRADPAKSRKPTAGPTRTDIVMREGKGQIGAEEEARVMSAAGVN